MQHNKAWKTFVASVFILLLNDGDIVYMQWRLITTLKTNARHCMFEWSAVSFPGLLRLFLCSIEMIDLHLSVMYGKLLLSVQRPCLS